MIKLIGYAPDLPHTTPGVCMTMNNLIPTTTGFEVARDSLEASSALASACIGAAHFDLVTTAKTYAGTSTKLYELSGSSWSDISRGGNYTISGNTVWSFTQFGDTSLAATLDQPIQSRTSGNFADISGAPDAKIVEAVFGSGGGFVFAFHTDAGVDVWHCCAANDVTSWTPSIARQCATGRLLGAPGPIVAAKQLASDKIVAYKRNSLYVGTYVGGDVVWQWQEYPGYGAAGQNAVVNLGTSHFVIGYDDIYIFDGVRPIPVGQNIRRDFFARQIDLSDVEVVFEKRADRVWVICNCNTGGDHRKDSGFVLHVPTGKWGIWKLMGSEMEEIVIGKDRVMYFDTSHKLQSANVYTVGSSSFTTGYIGSDDVISRVDDFRLHFSNPPGAYFSTGGSWPSQPASASIVGTTYVNSGEYSGTSGWTGSAVSIPGNGKHRFPVRQTGPFHQFTVSMTGYTNVEGYDVKIRQMGTR